MTNRTMAGGRVTADRVTRLLSVGLLLAATPAVAQRQEEGFVGSVEILTEYDDNLTLASGLDDEPKLDDFVFRLRPQVQLLREHRENRFVLQGRADWRKGFDEPLDELNLNASGLADLRHPSGWRLRATDTVARTTFDQALTFTGTDLAGAEPGVTRQLGNTFGVETSYTPVRRFSVLAGYQFLWEDFDFGAAGGGDTRRRHRFNGRVELPVSGDWIAYGVGRFQVQRSDNRVQFDYDDRRFAGGVRWTAPNEYVLFVEGGWQAIDFDDAAGTEFDEPVVLAGFEAPVTEESTFRASAGRNGYGDLVLSGEYSRLWDDQDLILNVRKSTENTFSNTALGRTFDAVVVSGAFNKDLGERWRAELEASYFRLEASGVTTLKNDTYNAAIRVLYQFRQWLQLGGRLRLLDRQSNDAASEFDDYRAGVFLRFTYQ